jgi:adenosine deaminase
VLTEKVIRRHLVIEVNPSSNLTIGPFEHLTEHPIFRWLDPRRELTGQNGPLLVVGSDDPSVFGTELIHEYAFLGRAAEELGATPRQIQAWLEHLRQASCQFSFFPRDAFKPLSSPFA